MNKSVNPGQQLGIACPQQLRSAEAVIAGYLQARICEVPDPDFQSMVQELCLCADLPLNEIVNQSLSYLLMVIVREKRKLTRSRLPIEGVLIRKVDKLPPDSVVHCACRELVKLKNLNIECFDGKTVLSLITQCHKSACPPLARPKALKRWQREYQFQAELIDRRRKNGDL